MTLFIGVFEKDLDSNEVAKAQKYFDGIFALDHNVLLIQDDTLTSPAAVSKFLDLTEEDDNTGVIFKLNGSHRRVSLLPSLGMARGNSQCLIVTTPDVNLVMRLSESMRLARNWPAFRER